MVTTGTANTKRMAEQYAAREALMKIKSQPLTDQEKADLKKMQEISMGGPQPGFDDAQLPKV